MSKSGDCVESVRRDFKEMMKDGQIFRIKIIGGAVGGDREVRQIVIIDRPTSSNGIWQVQTGVIGSILSLTYLHKIKMAENGIISGFRKVSGKRAHVTDIVLNRIVRIEGFSACGQVFRKYYEEE